MIKLLALIPGQIGSYERICSELSQTTLVSEMMAIHMVKPAACACDIKQVRKPIYVIPEARDNQLEKRSHGTHEIRR